MGIGKESVYSRILGGSLTGVRLTGQAGPTSRGIGISQTRSGLGPDLKISPAGPGAGWARRGRPRPARPHLRELTQPAKTVGLEILRSIGFLQFENITKRDINPLQVTIKTNLLAET